jgi:WhiB family transcriptional regulator, redox-sensing transcriptional regulator
MARVRQLDAQHATHRAQKRIKPGRTVGAQVTDNRLFHASNDELQIDADLRWEASTKVTDIAATRHPCELDRDNDTCTHPDHDRDAEWAKEALDCLDLPGHEFTAARKPPRSAAAAAASRPRLSRTTTLTPVDMTWHDRARCRGEDLTLFFGVDGERRPERELREHHAKQICGDCFFQTRCLDQNIDEKNGVFGGTTAEERKAERRRRQRRKRAA